MINKILSISTGKPVRNKKQALDAIFVMYFWMLVMGIGIGILMMIAEFLVK